jgi:membrane protein YqaA with SNARE-associated domain
MPEKAPLKALLRPIGLFLTSLGGVGILLLGIIDGSILFVPLGIDFLVVVLAARHHNQWPYYAAMAAIGSVIGCFTTDWIGRKSGEEGLERFVSKRRLRFIQGRVQAGSGAALAIAAVAPPGFPFTPVVLVAAALKYPRAKLLGIVGVCRFIRFSAEGLLAVRFGPKILKVAQTPIFEGTIVAVVIVSIVGSAWAIHSWRRHS